jgi:hypothetical protein
VFREFPEEPPLKSLMRYWIPIPQTILYTIFVVYPKDAGPTYVSLPDKIVFLLPSLFFLCRLENSANRLYYPVDPLLSNQYRVHRHISRKKSVEEIYTTPRTSSFFIVRNKSERDDEMIFSTSQYTNSGVKYFICTLLNTGSNGMYT